MAKNMVNDIIERIVEIINLSEKKEKELANSGSEEVLTEEFLGYYILKEYLKEFKDLCDAERTILIFQNTSAPLALNKKLIDKCDSVIAAKEENASLYEELKNLLMNALGKSLEELTEINGYYIERKSLSKFHELDHKLKFTNAINYTPEEVTEQLNHAAINNPAARKRRIDRYRVVNKIISFNAYKNKGNLSLGMANIRQDLLDSKHLEIVCLGLFGHLDLDGVRSLGYIYPEKEYTELLSELSTWGFFEPEELLDLKDNHAIVENPKLTEIIGQLALQKDLTFAGIYEFRNIEGIGMEGVKTMINILHMIKALSDEEYRKYTTFEISRELGVPFNTFKSPEEEVNPEFMNALMAYAESMGLGKTKEEILQNLQNSSLENPELKNGTSL